MVGLSYLDNRRLSVMKLLGTGITALQHDATKLAKKIVVFKTLLLTLRHQHPNQVTGSHTQISDELQLSGLQASLQSVQANISTAEPLYASLSAKKAHRR